MGIDRVSHYRRAFHAGILGSGVPPNPIDNRWLIVARQTHSFFPTLQSSKKNTKELKAHTGCKRSSMTVGNRRDWKPAVFVALTKCKGEEKGFRGDEDHKEEWFMIWQWRWTGSHTSVEPLLNRGTRQRDEIGVFSKSSCFPISPICSLEC